MSKMEKVKKQIEQEKTEVQMALEESEVLPLGSKAGFYPCGSAEDLHSNTTPPQWHLRLHCMLGTMSSALNALSYVITLADCCSRVNEEIEAQRRG